jgi:16S rRNA (cytidine1402-2'-O)-methyltransferase
MLYIVSTPIGNLKDITLRAIEVLSQVDLIAAEDTRRTRILLNHYNIGTSTISYNDLNRNKRIPYLIAMMAQGKSIALVSDAGTPGINDPGFCLVREAIRNNIKVSPIPGANAILSALACSGLPTDSFIYCGFLPKKEKRKIDFFRSIRKEKRTIVVYESPYRIMDSLQLMDKIIPEKSVCLCREMTKVFEEFVRGSPGQVLATLGQRRVKGEIVLVIS